MIIDVATVNTNEECKILDYCRKVVTNGFLNFDLQKHKFNTIEKTI
jgi:hypothetical protein